MSRKSELEIAGRKLVVSNLDKVLYPEAGFTKAQVIDYYIRIAPVLLPHLEDRPITLKRYPDGVEGFFFYEKQCPSHRPKWVKTTKVPSKREEGHIDYCVLNGLPALVWAANLADLELHTFLHRARAIIRRTISAQIGAATSGAFEFHAPRCDRVVGNVLGAIAQVNADLKI